MCWFIHAKVCTCVIMKLRVILRMICKALYGSSATCNSLSCLVIANWSAHAPAFNPILVLKSRSSMHHRHPWLHQTIWSNFQWCHSSIEVMDGMRWFSGMIWFDERFNLFFHPQLWWYVIILKLTNVFPKKMNVPTSDECCESLKGCADLQSWAADSQW